MMNAATSRTIAEPTNKHSSVSAKPTRKFSFVIPTYRRPDVLAMCLESIRSQRYDSNELEVIVIDNAEQENSSAVMKGFSDLKIDYIVNEKNIGPGGSLNKGLRLADGKRIVIMNDDAILPPNFLQHCDEAFDSDPLIGCLGFRVLEDNYENIPGGIGTISRTGRVIGNFDLDSSGLIEVEHIYGFCYAITRESLNVAGPFDTVLLAKPYASGNRIETDHCLSIRRAGLKVVYDSRMPVRHLAKPRLDIGERSLKWRLNDIRNTLYLFLKHFGLSGRGFLSLRYAMLHDLGIRSALLCPTPKNIGYFLTGVRGRVSAFGHYFLYLVKRTAGQR